MPLWGAVVALVAAIAAIVLDVRKIENKKGQNCGHNNRVRNRRGQPCVYCAHAYTRKRRGLSKKEHMLMCGSVKLMLFGTAYYML